MTIYHQNFRAHRGDSHTIHVALTQADGSPFDASLGAIIKWRLTRNPSDEADAVVRKEINDGITAVEGGVDILLETGDTDVPVGLYFHELKVWDADDVATAMQGFGVIRGGARMGSNITVLKGDLATTTTAPTRAP